MKNRARVLQEIIKLDDPVLNSELDYFLEEEREYSYDKVDALSDALDFAENNNDRKLLSKVRAVLIRAGGYCLAPVNTIALGHDDRFQFKGKKYKWPHSGGWEEWISE